MAQLDPRIILAGQPVDAVGSFQRGLQAAGDLRARQSEQRLSDLFRTHGPGIMRGEPGALEALSTVDPGAAMSIQRDQAERAGQLDAQGRARELQNIRQMRAIVERVGDERQWDDLARRFAPELVGQFANRDAITQRLRIMEAALDPQTPDEPQTMRVGDNVISLTPDGRGGFNVETLYSAPQEPPDDPEESALERRARLAGLEPGTEEYRQFMLTNGRGPGQTFRVTTPDGTSIELGQGSELGRSAQNRVEADLLDSAEVLTGLVEIERQFDPKFLEIETRLGAAWASIKDKLGRASQEDKALIAEYSAFRRQVLETLSNRLNALSGAAVSPQEFERIKSTLPSAGAGIFDGDSPTEFKAKLAAALDATRYEIMRQRILKANGLDGRALLGQREAIVAARAEMLDARFRQQYPDASDQEIQILSNQAVRGELGL